MSIKLRSTARTPNYEGTEETEWSSVDLNLEDFVSGYFRHNSDAERPDQEWEQVHDLSTAARRWIAARTLVGEVGAETVRDLISFPVVNPATNQLNANGLRAAISRAPQAQISQETTESIQRVARRLLDQEFEDEEEASGSVSEALQVASHALNRLAESFAETQERRKQSPPVESKQEDEQPVEEQQDSLKSSTARSLPWVWVPKQRIKSSDRVNDAPAFETSVEQMAGTVKDVSVSSRTVTGFYASYGNVDAHNEVFVQGAFAESIEKFGPNADIPRIKMLHQHRIYEPIGMPNLLEEREQGLYFEAQIPDTTLGTDVLKLYEAGVYTEHSVGFTRKAEEYRDDGVTVITQARLWEGSVVTWGANSQTPFTGFKSREDRVNALIEKASALRSVLKEGITDITAEQVELGLRQIEGALHHLDRQEQKDQDQDDTKDEEARIETPSGFFATNERKESTPKFFSIN